MYRNVYLKSYCHPTMYNVHVLNKKRSTNNGTIAQTRVGDRAGWPAAKHDVSSACAACGHVDSVDSVEGRTLEIRNVLGLSISTLGVCCS